MVEEKTDEKEAQDLKKLYKPYLDKRKDIVNSTKIKVEDVFGDIISKDSVSPEQLSKHNNFPAKTM